MKNFGNCSNEKATVAGELLRRREARRQLIPFVEYTFRGFETSSHHRLIAENLEAVERGDVDRLAILCPPRHSKSELASRRFPAWYLGRHPDRQIICCSYSDGLAVDFGRNVRDIIEDPRYGMLFPGTHIRADNRSAERWQTAQGGVYVSAGVGSGITGRGAHIALIDDPVKSRQESDSETHRNRVWEWYTNVLYTRLMPGGAIILIMTRWHEDDLAGRLLQAQLVGGDPWTVVDLPALAREGDPLRRQAGEALWASWYDEERLQRIRSALTVRDGPRAWEALYQCRPQPDEGDYFHSEWVKWYDWGDPPKPLARYGASDYAVTADGGDFTVHGVVGVSAEGDIYVLDWWRRQTDSGVWVEAAIDLMEKWRHVVLWAEERGQIEKSVGPFLTKRMQERGVFCRREAYTSSADKPTRARAIQGRMSMGKVYFPRDAPWSNRLVSELLRFPAGNHDDQVDVLSLFGRVLDSMHGASTPKREPVRPAGITGGQILSMLEQQRTIGRAGRYR